MRAILLDFGGTLDTDGVHWSEKFLDGYYRAGVRLSREVFRAAYREAERQMAAGGVLEADGLRDTLRRQTEFQWKVVLEREPQAASAGPDIPGRVAEWCLESVQATIAGIRPLLRSWAARYRLALLSNFYGNLEAVCRELSIAPYISVIVDSACQGVRKPEPAIFLAALSRLAIAPGEALMAGDSYENDIVPAKSIGCRTVYLRGRGWSVPSDLSAADFVIGSLADMQRIVLERIDDEEEE